MTSDLVFNQDDEKTLHSNKRYFHVVDAEEDPNISLSTSTLIDDHPPAPVESLDDQSLNKLYDEWLELEAELRLFEPKHKDYIRQLDEVESLKTKYRADIDKYKKKIDQLQKNLHHLRKSITKKDETTKTDLSNSVQINLKTSHPTTNLSQTTSSSPHSLPSVNSSASFDTIVKTLSSIERLNLLSGQIQSNSLYLSNISDTLPRKDSYLNVILGGVDVSILNKAHKWTYKQEYEKFKLVVTCISLVSSLVIWSLSSRYRAFDASFHFLLVWYYCTLTIRESILIVNGSNINSWWRAHHFISTVGTGILLTWPESPSYHTFRTQFFLFCFYLSFVQLLQFYYQRGCLYRLRALGERHDMDITVEGFHQWMFRGLSFLVPFLLIGYLFQLYNAYALWQLAHVSTTHEWQVLVMAIIFFVLFLGNILTTSSVLREKLREKPPPILLKEKYQNLATFLSTNYHRSPRSYQQMETQQRKEELNQNDSFQQRSKEE